MRKLIIWNPLQQGRCCLDAVSEDLGYLYVERIVGKKIGVLCKGMQNANEISNHNAEVSLSDIDNLA